MRKLIARLKNMFSRRLVSFIFAKVFYFLLLGAVLANCYYVSFDSTVTFFLSVDKFEQLSWIDYLFILVAPLFFYSLFIYVLDIYHFFKYLYDLARGKVEFEPQPAEYVTDTLELQDEQIILSDRYDNQVFRSH